MMAWKGTKLNIVVPLVVPPGKRAEFERGEATSFTQAPEDGKICQPDEYLGEGEVRSLPAAAILRFQGLFQAQTGREVAHYAPQPGETEIGRVS
jgi:hypothetical protein